MRREELRILSQRQRWSATVGLASTCNVARQRPHAVRRLGHRGGGLGRAPEAQPDQRALAGVVAARCRRQPFCRCPACGALRAAAARAAAVRRPAARRLPGAAARDGGVRPRRGRPGRGAVAHHGPRRNAAQRGRLRAGRRGHAVPRARRGQPAQLRPQRLRRGGPRPDRHGHGGPARHGGRPEGRAQSPRQHGVRDSAADPPRQAPLRVRQPHALAQGRARGGVGRLQRPGRRRHPHGPPVRTATPALLCPALLCICTSSADVPRVLLAGAAS